MQKIASPEHLTRELHEILSYAQSRHPERQRIARQLIGLAERVAGTKLSSRGKPLYGYDSMANAYNVDDYPYGRQLRCKIRYWLEKKANKGFRFMSQTEDPKRFIWNKPKASTYATLAACMYLDGQDHVKWAALTEYSKDGDILEFVKDFPKADFSILQAFVKPKIKYLTLAAEGKVVWKINGVPQPVTEEDMGRAKRELEGWQQVEKLI